jgi:catechol 2,3-dioxygenase-like lactoylglutathione lyase family enzyme
MKSSCRLSRFGLTTANADHLAQFYENAFGCRRIAAEHVGSSDLEKATDMRGGTECRMLALGREKIELTQFDKPGQPYPANSLASDLIFQHFAIVVSDMTKAFQRLCAVEGWSTITQGGPQRLPESSGSVTAFKFRDPEGHPLEFLAFPTENMPLKWRVERNGDTCQGIDHSAIVIADGAASRAFYENLGFRVSGHSLNRGIEQEKLDGIPGVQVEVTALSPTDDGPHIEFLRYQSPTHGAAFIQQSNDVAATRVVLLLSKISPLSGPRCEVDPDGHHLTIAPEA